jgi:hypothetical protein
MVGFFEGLFRRPDLTYYAEFLAKLNEGLARDPRFETVQWFALVNHRPRGTLWRNLQVSSDES